MQKLRLGIIGAGSVIEQYHLPVIQNIPGIQLDWIVDDDLSRAKALTDGFGIKTRISDNIDDLDDVDICLLTIPVGYRRSLAEKAFARHWNLLCEKPFAVTADEHKWYLEKAREAKVVVGCGFMRRYYAGNVLGKKLVAANPFGALRGIKASQGGKLRGTGRDTDSYQIDVAAAGGGILIETGSHVIDQILFVTQASGFVLGDIKSPELSKSHGQQPETEISVEAMLQLGADKNPNSVPLALSLSSRRDLFCGIELEFEHGFVRLGMAPDSPVTLLDRRQSKIASIVANEGAMTVYQAFYMEWVEFIEAVTRDIVLRQDNSVLASTSLLTTNLIDSVYARFRGQRQNLEAA